ncbi:MAG TPA: hypothetical protein VN088_06655, partial [Nocardioides sp.]|nr:hypothetical protein [Nocardioides sp.]
MALDPTLTDRLASALATTPDRTSSYGTVVLDESSSVDLMLQTPASPVPFALWYGAGLPRSARDDGFADEATCEELPDGTVLARYEQANIDGGEVYELVRILVAFTPDLVVTVNRYADPDISPDADDWSFEDLRD